jgi:peroxiredoxin
MKRSIRVFFLLILVFLLTLTCSKNKNNQQTSSSEQSQTKVAPEEGYYAPGFQLLDLNGKAVSLTDYNKKIVLVNFWATWCGFCKKEIPSMEALYQMLNKRGFEILAISVDRLSPAEVKSFVLKYKMSFPVLLNPFGDIAKQYNVPGLPASFLVDQKGIIRWKVIGARDWMDERIIEKIEELLGPPT